MSDIVERLRILLGEGIGNEAANEIETLRQRVNELESELDSLSIHAGRLFPGVMIQDLFDELATLKQAQEPVAWYDDRADGNEKIYWGEKPFYAGEWEPLYTSAPTIPAGWRLNEREHELIDGMIEVQLHHSIQCDGMGNRSMAEKQKGWNMERVALLEKIKLLSAAPKPGEAA